MDPQQCLIEAAELLKSDRTECAYRLADYFKWRLHGGFEPMLGYVHGDEQYIVLLAQLGRVADTLSEALV